MDHLPRRKGAIRRSEIPPDVLRGLNEGREETITLVEWLAIDIATLLRAIVPDVGLVEARDQLEEVAMSLASEGVTKRLKGIGEALFRVTQHHPKRREVFHTLASHGSDMVRAWACLMLTSDKTLSLSDRLQATHQFASDRSVAVRECAWDSFRPYLLADLSHSFNLLESWVRSPDPDIRRCAVEATRPRGGWTTHIEALTQDPEPGLRLLELVRSDPSRYVQRSVGNWLNDASKTRPDWVRVVCTRWTSESPCWETHWIVNWALRTLRKNEVR